MHNLSVDVSDTKEGPPLWNSQIIEQSHWDMLEFENEFKKYDSETYGHEYLRTI